jgi:hypothetical protein
VRSLAAWSLSADERCLWATADENGDKLVGCADPDCSTCGNGTCEPVEDHVICPVDCP